MNAIKTILAPSNKPDRWLSTVVIVLAATVGGAAVGGFSLLAFEVVLAVLIGAAALFLSIRNERFPMYLLISMLALAELLKVDIIPSTLLILPGGLAIISLLAAIFLRRSKVFVRSPILLFAVLLGIWASIATAWVGSLSESRPYWLVIILLFLVPNLLTRLEHLLRAAWCFLLPLGILGVYVFLDRISVFLTSQEIDLEKLHLAPLVIGDRNTAGMWLTLGLPFVYYLYGYYKNEPRKRFWLLLAGGGMLAGAVATLSIGVAIGLVVMFAMIVWLQPGVTARLRLLVLAGLVTFLIFSGPLSQRLQMLNLTTLDESWGSNRGELWSAGYHTILDHPVFGIGLDPARRSAMMLYIQSWFIQQWYAAGVLVVPHNILLSVGVDIGLPGLVLYLAMLGAVFLLLWNLRRRLAGRPSLQVFANILLVAIMTGWAQGMGLSVHLDKMTWFLMACTIALANITSLEKNKNT